MTKTTAKKTARLYVEVEYDPDVTDPESLASGLDSLLETALSTAGVLDEYGDPKIGSFYCSGWIPAEHVKTIRQFHQVLVVAGFGTERDINGADLVDAINVAFPGLDRAVKTISELP